jgi:hypothetical protein
MLPFEPQTVEELKARYPLAVAPLFRVEDVLAGGARPGQDRAHVLDWPDGMRWVVSREGEGGRVVLHLSASAFRGTELFMRIARGELNVSAFCQLVEDRFRAVAGRGPPPFLEFSPGKGIPHWVGPA